jgi:uncharacterized membrane protein
MYPSALQSVMQKLDDDQVARGLEAARHRAVHAAARRERSRVRFARTRSRKPGLRTEP